MFLPQLLGVLLVSLLSVYFLQLWSYDFCSGPRVDHCSTSKYSSCFGDHNFTWPFRFKSDHPGRICTGPEYELSCKHNRTILPLHLHDLREQEKYLYVEPDSIDYTLGKFRVIDPGVQNNNCSNLPLFSLGMLDVYNGNKSGRLSVDPGTDILIFVSCKNPVNSTSPLYVDTSSCNITANRFSDDHSFSSKYSYVVVGKDLSASDIEDSCTIFQSVPAQIQSLPSLTANVSYQDIHNLLTKGFELSWYPQSYVRDPFFCSLLSSLGPLIATQVALLVVAARSTIGIMFLLAFLIYKWKRRHLSIYDKIEEFLQKSSNLMPIRYSYKEIKAITSNFKEKLGEGGYGLVYKGKLRSGSLVAVKMLNKSKANGQEFINEVATIGRIHHFNVVRLVGFCVTPTKHALVYDYMPNGSLDKFIFSEHSNGDRLNWKKAYEIAAGIARGIEYLHQGCNMQILHFDIKPHNILLDENFVPKVSDFGLAKLYPVQNSVATLTAVRGTLGYMAPELFYKKIGKVSYKADVYSFGMLLMEIAGRRRNVNAHVEHSSQIYYPSWIYDKFDQEEEIDFGDHLTEEERGIARKLILIALRCIQITPTDRPSMREVLKMLEGDIGGLELPPKPLFYPPDSPIISQRSSYTSSEESTEPLVNSVTMEIEQIDE